MKLISWNVNGLRACMNKGFEDFLRVSEADAFCLQETKMQREQADFVFDGYEEYWNSAEKKGYSGTAIFSKNVPLNVTSNFCFLPSLITVTSAWSPGENLLTAS